MPSLVEAEEMKIYKKRKQSKRDKKIEENRTRDGVRLLGVLISVFWSLQCTFFGTHCAHTCQLQTNVWENNNTKKKNKTKNILK